MPASTDRSRRPIQRLDPRTVERIAAGEVVERPASVVKELVENAYDAGASTVVVRIAGGGLERIEVADDGAGIPAEELELAVERHATSKLAPDDPVEAIVTLGFRGEALAAIGAVSELELLSAPAGAAAAEGVELRGGEIVRRFAEGRAPGTTVRVERLFFNTPARRKFLKVPAREQVEVVRALEHLYLARPTVGLRLEGETGELLSLPAATNLREAAGRVLGPEFAATSFPLRARSGGVEVEGELGAPAAAASTSSALYLAVNGRPVASRALAQSVRLGYGDTIPKPRYPVGVVHLRLDPSTVDVNVHPTKREVRLASPREVEAFVRHAVRDALADSDRTAQVSGAPRPGSSAAGSSRVVAPAVARPVPPLSPLRQRTLAVGEPSPASWVLPAEAHRPRLELLSPIDALYWVAVSDDGLVLLDQHAASERLLYEAVRSGGVVARQQLVAPAPLSLSASERASLEAHADEVRAAGFQVERFGPATYRVLAVPTFRGRAPPAAAVAELVRELADGSRPTVPDGLAERRAASIACHAALRAGDVVERATVAGIVLALDRLPDRPRTCPHGRPIFVQVSRARLDRWFLRSGG